LPSLPATNLDPCLSLGAGAEYAAGTRLDALTVELARVVQETLQPEHVEVWLKKMEIER